MHRRIGPDGGRKVGWAAVYEDVDVGSKPRAFLDQPVAHTWRGRVERSEHVIDRVARQLLPPLDAGKERQQRAWQQHGRHGQSRTTASTAQISGRLPVTSCQDSPSFELCHSCPVFVPNVTPTGSSESRAIASRSTLR